MGSAQRKWLTQEQQNSAPKIAMHKLMEEAADGFDKAEPGRPESKNMIFQDAIALVLLPVGRFY